MLCKYFIKFQPYILDLTIKVDVYDVDQRGCPIRHPYIAFSTHPYITFSIQ
jgi:hypothetical protein